MYKISFYWALFFLFSYGFAQSQDAEKILSHDEADERNEKAQPKLPEELFLGPNQLLNKERLDNSIHSFIKAPLIKPLDVGTSFDLSNKKSGDLRPPISYMPYEIEANSEAEESVRIIDVSGEGDEVISDTEYLSEPLDRLTDSREFILWSISTALFLILVLAGILFAKLWRSFSDFVRGAKRSNHEQMRAYLSMRATSIHLGENGSPLHVTLEMHNHGKTPAHSIDIASGIHIFDYPLSRGASHPEMYSYDKKSYLLPGDSTQISSIGQSHLNENSMNVAHCSNTKRIYIFTFISYKDIDEKSHFTLSCFSIAGLERTGDRWIPHFEDETAFNSIGTLEVLREIRPRWGFMHKTTLANKAV